MDTPTSDSTPNPTPKPPRSFKGLALAIGSVIALGIVAYTMFLAPAKPAKVRPLAETKAGDIIPVIGTRYLTFAGPEPMKNAAGEIYVFGDRCRAFDRGTLEVRAADETRVLSTYRNPRERPTNTKAGVDMNAKDEVLDCPELAPVIFDHDEWQQVLRDCRVTGGSQDALREWVREQLTTPTPSH